MSAEEMSKSAKKRAAKKARDEAHAAAEAPQAEPAPKAKAKAKAEAAAPAPEPKAKAKAKGKAAEPAPAPKAEAKAKAKAEPKAEGKAKAKSKAKKQQEEAPPPRKTSEHLDSHVEMDDGTGADWETVAVVSKKNQRRQEKQEEEKKAAEQAEIAAKKAEKEAAKAKSKAAAKPAAEAPKAKAKASPAPAPESAAPAAAPVAAKAEEPAEPDPNVTVTVKVPSDKIGRIIGPRGANIELIKSKTNVKTIDTTGGEVNIVGLPDDVAVAEAAVKELAEKGYMALAFEDFKDAEVSVEQNAIPNIIGSRGAIIQEIKKVCKVEIDIAKVPPTAPKSQKVKVKIAGEGAGVEKAKDVIASIAQFGYHEVTHPGHSHAEMEVEEHKYRFLIGKGGSEMRHIQNSYKVKVNIPRENPGKDPVVVIGEKADVERAVKYMEKQLADADQPRTREVQEKPVDTWKEERDQPEEAWMSQYIKKR